MSASASLFILVVILATGALGYTMGIEGVLLPAAAGAMLLGFGIIRAMYREVRFKQFIASRRQVMPIAALKPSEISADEVNPWLRKRERFAHQNLRDAHAAVRNSTPPEVRAGMPFAQLIVLALVVRILFGLFMNLTGLNLKLAPDSIGYQIYGGHILHSWMDPRYDPNIIPGYKPTSFWQNANAVGVYIFGDSAYIFLGIVNCFVGVYAAWLVGLIAKDLWGAAAQRKAFVLAAFFPSIVMWTSINLRDAWSYVAVLGAVLAAQRLRNELSTREIVRLVVSLSLMPFIRSYMLVLTVAGILASFIIVRIRQIPYAILGVVLVGFMFTRLEQSLELRVSIADPAQNLATMHALKTGLGQTTGGSHYDSGIDISTPQAAALYLPLGIMRFMFSPFPWRVHKPQQLIAFLEVLVWIVVCIASLRGMWLGFRTSAAHYCMPMFVAIVTCLAYSLVESNEGTAFRHRAQVLLLCFVYAGGFYARDKRAVAARRSSYPAPPLLAKASMR